MNQPVGVFDSGVGGLSVLRHIREALPHESLLYVADSQHAPYGEKTADHIRQRASHLTEFLISQGAKAIVVACNTATAAAASHLRSQFSLPILGMEPAVKPAAASSKRGVIGVLATTGTLKSAQFAALLDTWGKSVEIVTEAGAGLVECVERGELDTPATRALVAQHVAPLIAAGADTIVLGCTHYPFLRAAIEASTGPGITLVDTGAAVARHLAGVLSDSGLLNDSADAGATHWWTSADPAEASRVMSRLWGDVVVAAKLP